MLDTLVHYCKGHLVLVNRVLSIMLSIRDEGKECLDKLKEMKMLCAFQSEVESGLFKRSNQWLTLKTSRIFRIQ